jgi:anti-sigma B factor antagonist
MPFSVRPISRGRAFRLEGELDLATVDRLIEHLEPVARDRGDLYLDLEALEFMDSSGIDAVIGLCDALQDRGRVVLLSPSGEVAKLLRLVRADTFPNLVIEGPDWPC